MYSRALRVMAIKCITLFSFFHLDGVFGPGFGFVVAASRRVVNSKLPSATQNHDYISCQARVAISCGVSFPAVLIVGWWRYLEWRDFSGLRKADEKRSGGFSIGGGGALGGCGVFAKTFAIRWISIDSQVQLHSLNILNSEIYKTDSG
jgi:hypothetical protein